MRMLDKYFRNPVAWDCFISAFAACIGLTGIMRFHLRFSNDEILLAVGSDLATVSLTLAGFILTLMTVLISFKSTAKPKHELNLETDTLFNIFFSTDLYFQTVRHLRNAIISLTLLAIVGYSFKLLLPPNQYWVLFIFHIFSLGIIMLTLFRCLLILSRIVKIQKEG